MNSPTTAEALKTTQSSVYSIRVIEARLTVSVAKFGSMALSVQLTYGSQSFRTNEAAGPDSNPRWDQMQLFEISEAQVIKVRVLHKAILIGDVEVAHCSVSLPELSRRRNNDWWALSRDKATVGSIKLSFCFDEDMKGERSPSPPHVLSTEMGFCELKEELLKKMNELELEKEELEYYKLKYKRKMEELNQEKRKYRARLQAIDMKLRQDRTLDENESKMVVMSPTTRLEVSTSGTDDLGRRQKSLNLRENSLVAERKRIQDEKQSLDHEREQLTVLKEQIAQEYAKLKREKHKLMAQRKNAGLRRCDTAQTPQMRETASEDQLRKPRADTDIETKWREIEQIRATLSQKQVVIERHLQCLQEEQQRFREEQEEWARQQARSGSNDPARRSGRTPQRSEKIPKSPYSKGSERAVGRLLVFN